MIHTSSHEKHFPGKDLELLFLPWALWSGSDNAQAKREAMSGTHGYPAELHYLIPEFLQMEKNL